MNLKIYLSKNFMFFKPPLQHLIYIGNIISLKSDLLEKNDFL